MEVSDEITIKEEILDYVDDKSWQNDESYSPELQLIQPKLEAKEEINVYLCMKCNESFMHKELLDFHEIIHSKSRWRCRFHKTPKTFTSNEEFKAHIQQHLDMYLTCKLCDKVFVTKGDLFKHYVIHQKDKQFVCTYCESSFQQATPFVKHLRIHTNEKPYTCEHCSKSFKQSDSLKCHSMLIHENGEKFQCSTCLGKFATKKTLNKHIKIVHAQGKVLMCSICSKTFVNKDLLNQHKVEQHTGITGFYKVCPICMLEFFTQDLYDSHNHDDVKKEEIDLSEEETTSKVNPQAPESPTKSEPPVISRQVNCPLCDEKVFVHNFRSHRLQHIIMSEQDIELCVKNGSFPCKKCKTIFKTEHELFTHMDAHMEKRYKCDKTCESKSETLFTYAGLKYHQLRHHVFFINCCFCDAKIPRKQYIEHQNEHMDLSEKELIECKKTSQYPCKKCDFVGINRAYLVKHMMVHLPKDFVCFVEDCPKKDVGFSINNFKIHNRSYHKELMCSKCEISFVGLKKFNRHLRQCKPKGVGYQCKWCSRVCTSLIGLVYHYKTEELRSSYKCSMCRSTFVSPFQLRKHLLEKHKNRVTMRYCYEELVNDNKKKQEYNCTWCKVPFKNKKQLSNHEAMHKSNRHQCVQCQVEIAKFPDYLSHLRNKTCWRWKLEALIPTFNSSECFVCRQTFAAGVRKLAIHVVHKHLKEPITCQYCQMEVPLDDLTEHLAKTHSEDTKYFCNSCDMSFVNFPEYAQHKSCCRPKSLVNSDLGAQKQDNKCGTVKDEDDDDVDMPNNVMVNDDAELVF